MTASLSLSFIGHDRDGERVGYVEVDTFDDGEIVLEVFDESALPGNPTLSGLTLLTADEARQVAAALNEAAYVVDGKRPT